MRTTEKSANQHKVRNFIVRFGKHFIFMRNRKDEFNEPTKDFEKIEIIGVFHESNSYISKGVEDGALYRTKPSPQIMYLSDESMEIKVGDFVEYHKIKYIVTAVSDYNNLGIATDISLEVVDDGNDL